MNNKFLKELKDNYKIVFKDVNLLEEAFTHSSYANEHLHLNLKSNERLEFLGDAVLQFLISKYIFTKYSDLPEGKLSPLRSFIVREDSLAQFAKKCHFDQYILLGKGEKIGGGCKRPSLLCDLFEAFIGALEQDQGLDKVKKFIDKVMIPKINSGCFLQEKDFKTVLQEKLQKNGDVLMEYRLTKEAGPAHERIFYISVYLKGKEIGEGIGKSKKQAEQRAAETALLKMKEKVKEHGSS
ncbi:MAG: ribonuclease III [Streptococcaceae bacterium]|jgi:ribonuclease-3|nr:ribonuclease III [Streptococcaceae bacterium]